MRSWRWLGLVPVAALVGTAMAQSTAPSLRIAPVGNAAAVWAAFSADKLSGDLTPAHDPAVIKQGDTYYVFTTSQESDRSGLINVRSSKDLMSWKREPSVFSVFPTWAKKSIPGTVGIWAPDIVFSSGRYRVYYSVSTFGSNRSAIGMASSPTLDPAAPGYGWRDEGEVFSSRTSNDYNAIDPHIALDREGQQWFAFGSFWTGLKMFRLDPALGRRQAADTALVSIARRPPPGDVEGAYIIDRGGYYYLFASYGSCCRGVNSTYFSIVGRSTDIKGPYLDADGKQLMKGLGQVVLHGDLDKQRRWRGPGHLSILRDGPYDYLVYHAYDARNKGIPTLRVSKLLWTKDGWPVVKL